MPSSQTIIGSKAISTSVDVPFTVNRGGNETRGLNVTTVATAGAGLLLPVQESATSFRIHVLPGGGGRVAFTLGDGTGVPLIPQPADANGANGVPGNRTLDPGGVEVFGMTDEQTRLAGNGALVFRGICAAGSAIVEITLGNGN